MRARVRMLRPKLKTLRPLLASPVTEIDGKRIKTQPGAEWYRTEAWRRLRISVLERDRFTCRQTGVLLVGRHPAPDSPVVDHIRPHRGDPDLFWDPENLQSVSKAWHDSVKQGREKRGEV